MKNKPHLPWMLAALAMWLAAFFITAFLPLGAAHFDWRWALSYAALEIMLVGGQFRLRPQMHPALSRLLALVTGVAALLGALAVGNSGRVPQIPFFSGLVGLAGVTLLARVAPAPLARLWFARTDGKEAT